jgi:hypothetical protein
MRILSALAIEAMSKGRIVDECAHDDLRRDQAAKARWFGVRTVRPASPASKSWRATFPRERPGAWRATRAQLPATSPEGS